MGPRSTLPLLITPPQSASSSTILSRVSAPAAAGWGPRAVLFARLGPRLERMGLARGIEARDAFVHVPAEGADHADVVVVRHLAVGHDVELSLLLIDETRA